MTFSYQADLTNPLDYVRFKLNDKEEDWASYSDEELNYFLGKLPNDPTENDLNKLALKLLKQQLQELLRSPSRERSGAFEVYKATSDSLKMAIQELESEIRSITVVKPYFGGVKKQDVRRNREDKSILQGKFYDGRIYRHHDEFPENDI
jgi:hypothetical protein